jgi:hypothetical protein
MHLFSRSHKNVFAGEGLLSSREYQEVTIDPTKFQYLIMDPILVHWGAAYELPGFLSLFLSFFLSFFFFLSFIIFLSLFLSSFLSFFVSFFLCFFVCLFVCLFVSLLCLYFCCLKLKCFCLYNYLHFLFEIL